MKAMNTLATILSSRVRASIFELLFGLNREELHIRELARRSGLSEASLRQELVKLKRLELVRERRSGNRLYIQSNETHPLFPEIHSLVLKTAGLADVFVARLSGKKIRFAFIFGSVANAQEVAHSDVDLMVIGSIGLRKLSELLAGASEQIAREINPHVMTEMEYLKRQKEKDHFVTHVLSGKKIFVIGTENDFEKLGT